MTNYEILKKSDLFAEMGNVSTKIVGVVLITMRVESPKVNLLKKRARKCWMGFRRSNRMTNFEKTTQGVNTLANWLCDRMDCHMCPV